MDTVIISLIALGVILLLAGYVSWILLFPVLEVMLNLAVLYLIFLRSRVEIIKESKTGAYFGGAVIGMALYLITGNIFSGILVWGITYYAITSFFLSQAWAIIHKKRIESGKNHQ